MKRLLTILSLLLVTAVAGWAQDMPVASDAPVGPRDVLDVKVQQDPSLNTHGTVADDGKITLPLVGKVDVSGLTPAQVEQRVKGLLEARYMTRADVTVQVAEYGNKPISVIGAVTHPGRIGATGNMTLIQAITQAGGLAPGYGRTLYVLRTGKTGLSEQLAIDIEDLMVNGNPDLNIPLTPNDVINVPVDTPVTVYVLGEVMRPGTVQFRRSQNPTLLQALAGAGGPTDRASKKVVIKRGAQTIDVNYRRIVDGQQPDLKLLDNDTLYVKESFF